MGHLELVQDPTTNKPPRRRLCASYMSKDDSEGSDRSDEVTGPLSVARILSNATRHGGRSVPANRSRNVGECSVHVSRPARRLGRSLPFEEA